MTWSGDCEPNNALHRPPLPLPPSSPRRSCGGDEDGAHGADESMPGRCSESSLDVRLAREADEAQVAVAGTTPSQGQRVRRHTIGGSSRRRVVITVETDARCA